MREATSEKKRKDAAIALPFAQFSAFLLSLGKSTVHTVKVSSFYLGKHKVTQAQWSAVMGNHPNSFEHCDSCPVETVSWKDAQAFIAKLNARLDHAYRLPTNAEWEHAAQGGIHPASYAYAGGNELKEVAWYKGNSGGKTHPVGKKHPNALGLHDMRGNVWEWCADWYDIHYYQACVRQGGVVNPSGPASGTLRVLRGGSWGNTLYNQLVFCRYANSPDYPRYYFGFRLARTP